MSFEMMRICPRILYIRTLQHGEVLHVCRFLLEVTHIISMDTNARQMGSLQGSLGDCNPSWEASYVKPTLFSTYVEIVPKSAIKFYLDFAHRFHHDELHFMINIADVTHPHALVVRDKRPDWDLSAGDLAICVCKGRCTDRQNW